MDDRPSPRGLFAVVVAASLWGSWSLFLRPSGLPAELSSPLVLLLVGVSSLLFVRLDQRVPKWDRRTLELLAIHSVCGAINVGTFFAAMARTSVAIAVLTHYLAPILVALATPWIDGRRVKGAVLAALLATLGLALVLAPWTERVVDGAEIGALLGTTSAFAYAGSIFAMRRLTERIGAMRTQGYHALVAALLLAPLVMRVDPEVVTMKGLVWIALGSLLPGTIAGLLFLSGLRRIGAARATVLALCEPMIAVAIGAIVFGEELAATAGIGAGLILVGGMIVSVKREE